MNNIPYKDLSIATGPCTRGFQVTTASSGSPPKPSHTLEPLPLLSSANKHITGAMHNAGPHDYSKRSSDACTAPSCTATVFDDREGRTGGMHKGAAQRHSKLGRVSRQPAEGPRVQPPVKCLQLRQGCLGGQSGPSQCGWRGVQSSLQHMYVLLVAC